MPTTFRPQQRYDHRLRDLVQRKGDLRIATERGVPRSTARGWRAASPTVVVSLDVVNLTEPELRQEVLKLRRRVGKLAALLRLALALLHASGFKLARDRLPDGCAKLRILRAVDQAASAFRCEGSYDSFMSRRAGFRLGADASVRVHSTISRPVPAPHHID